MTWNVAQTTLTSRFLLGTASYPSPQIMMDSVRASGTEVITVSLKRQAAAQSSDPGGRPYFAMIRELHCHLLPNTAGCHTAAEAISLAHMAREVFDTPWVKLEVIGDQHTLQPDVFELVSAAEALVKDGFQVFPYCTEDLVACQRLLDVGCTLLMPWAAPIGSGQGLVHLSGLRTLRERLPDVPLIVDAGIGSPMDATQAMELGFDGVLLNSAVSRALNPVQMAEAFKWAIHAGRLAFEAGIMAEQDMAMATTPVTGRPFLIG
ncbi:MAG TPA: thiazole synthase [Castellaniella sp.]|uniref:thiazole synthase n=1 Tax=Castellaniella sp. TaxID=1955812 RepID=UPI002F0D26AA